ncbi:MAG: hypothetical protein KKC26_08695 [Nanoarchaeota archaeon]|nr:hypothetical protein [Nanoarchaeota archaeon]
MWGFIQDAKTVLKKEDQTIKKNSHAEEKIKKKLERIKLLLEKAKSFERFIFRLEENILEKLKKESSKEKLFVAEQLVEKAKTISEFLDGSIEFIDCFKENTKENVSQKSDLLKKKLERIKREIAGFIKLEKKELKMLHE